MKKNQYALISILIGCLFIEGCLPAVVAGAGVAAVGTNASASSLSIGTQIDDASIKSRANNILMNLPELQYQSNVEVAVFNGIVLITGQVPNNLLKTHITEQIAAINGGDGRIIGPKEYCIAARIIGIDFYYLRFTREIYIPNPQCRFGMPRDIRDDGSEFLTIRRKSCVI